MSQDNDIHEIEKVKGCLFPWFCCKQTHYGLNGMQIDTRTLPFDLVEALSLWFDLADALSLVES